MPYDERIQALSDDMSLLSEGDINPAQMGLRALGETGGLIGDWVAPVLDAVTPEFVQKGIEEVMSGVMDTGPAKYALKWLEEHPEQARDISSAFNAAQLLPGLSVSKTLKSAAHNMPNELAGFYGSGALGQWGSVAKGVPTTLAHMGNQALNPKAQARREGGVSPRLRATAQEKLKNMDKDPTSANKEASFLTGQLDQSSLLAQGSGESVDFLDNAFRPIQDLNAGPMDQANFKTLFTTYKPENYAGMDLDDELMGQLEKRVRKAQGIAPDEDVRMVVRHPTATTDLAPEMMGGKGSPTAKRMYAARKHEQALNPGKTKFNDVDEAKEFVATRALVDSSIVRKDGRPMTKADRAEVKAFGPREGKYKKKEEGNGNVKAYYKYKAMEQAGDKFTKPQREKYDMLKKRVANAKDNVEVDSKGRVYTQSSHKSTAKGLGGVNDQFAVDLDGNVLSFINDENDLFGLKVPGDKRVVSVTPPIRYNVFSDLKNSPDTAGAAQRTAHRGLLEDTYGAQDKGARGLERQIGEAVVNYNPQVQGRHVGRAAGNAGQLGLFGALMSTENEEE